MQYCNDAIVDIATVKMAPPLEWNPNGNYEFQNIISNLRQGENYLHVRTKRGGGGMARNVTGEDAVMKFATKIEPNTPKPEKGNFTSFY